MKKAAVIGLGDISPIHLAAIAGNPDIELCAVCDIDPEAGQRAPEGVPFYTDYEEMLREAKPDCVHVCLPHYLHYPVSKYFAEHGVNVFCEKPVAMRKIRFHPMRRYAVRAARGQGACSARLVRTSKKEKHVSSGFAAPTRDNMNL